jgi:hypothetical protein
VIPQRNKYLHFEKSFFMAITVENKFGMVAFFAKNTISELRKMKETEIWKPHCIVELSASKNDLEYLQTLQTVPKSDDGIWTDEAARKVYEML